MEETNHWHHLAVAHETLPSHFTNPFEYRPHQLVQLAFAEMAAYIETHPDLGTLLQEGKMLGVLVVGNQSGAIGFLAAFSGLLGGTNRHPYFVPPIYDLLDPNGFFLKEEAVITQLNRELEAMKQHPSFQSAQKELNRETEAADARYNEMKTLFEAHRAVRQAKRALGCTPEELAKLIKESQFEKAELKRLAKRNMTVIEEKKKAVKPFTDAMQRMADERKKRSAVLQTRLFEQFMVKNAKGEERNLLDIFAPTPQKMPPAGAGECALPKLLQYAYNHGWRPIASGECWWGASPTHEIRHHGVFYPACSAKCKPILGFMLQGLPVEEGLPTISEADLSLKTVYEDAWLIVVNKPSGLLAVPGKASSLSVPMLLEQRGTKIWVVHRLDRDTSGLLLLAKTEAVYKQLQQQFAEHQVFKRYRALLDGKLAQDEGVVDLPLLPDIGHRPYQRVDFNKGKQAMTRFRKLIEKAGCTLVDFFPKTGRTHQLRVHAAHPAGLGCPIMGDPLYGRKKARRLCLHAAELHFLHPVSGETIRIVAEEDFGYLQPTQNVSNGPDECGL